MAKITIKDLLDAGVHFGHPTKRWNPKMKPYIYGARNGIYIFDLPKTMRKLQETCQFLYKIATEGKKILFVATKRQAQDVVRETAEEIGMYHMTERWPGGTLTNGQTIQHSIKKMTTLQDMEANGALDSMPKKEAAKKRRELSKLRRSFQGIADMRKLPGAVFVVDIRREDIAVREANRLNIPVVAVVDTNCDPDPVDFLIPANDDALRSIKLILDAVKISVQAGLSVFEKVQAEEDAKRQAERAKKEKEAAEAAERAAKARQEKAKKVERKPAPRAEAPKAEAKPAPKAEKKPAAPKAEDKPAKKAEKKPEAPKAEDKPAKKAEKKPAAPKAEDKPAKKAEKKPEAPKAEDKPAKKAEKKPAAPKAEDKPAKKAEKKPAAPKAEAKPAPKAEKKPAAPKAEDKPAEKKPAEKKPAEKKPAKKAEEPKAKEETK